MVMGLGNPGATYAATRHNVGFIMLDGVAASHNAGWREKSAFKAQVAELNIGQQRLLLVKPTTFYNASGEAAQALLHFYKLTPSALLVVHDELDLPFGMLRTRQGGRDAGNNGIKSIIGHIGEDFARLRIGIAHEVVMHDRQDFVLARFTKTETELLPSIKQQAARVIEDFAREYSLEHQSIKI